MKLLTFIAFLTLVTYVAALPQPDTNIQIQHYDGPVYLGNTTPNCCPFCNSIIKPENECKTTPEYPQVYGNTFDNEPYEVTISVGTNDPCENDKNTLGSTNLGPSENCKSLLHTSIHNIPVTCYGTGKNTRSPVTPLSNYLPINTACQNTCQVPILTYNGNGDETVLVPQKFMYSLILDGEVGTNQNACDSRMYYYR
ncbi:uncharacterized protein LOC125237349 [Leguminivora glycinivorella]|uniref:uncharacterized protein LOC125237349 n=1 Tax=Leguminivora glycinivorella TaxID=1035111 RepID=UPI00200EC017|nr:uncharacterized protein LOC125237349 [Leguminivora glycinivorella]